jgi:hypothetical protein
MVGRIEVWIVGVATVLTDSDGVDITPATLWALLLLLLVKSSSS